MLLQLMLANPTDKQITYNATYDDLYRPSQGPSNPYKTNDGSLKRKNLLTGEGDLLFQLD